MLDWENGAAFYDWVAQPGGAVALAADVRWPKLRAELNELGRQYKVTFPAAPTQVEMAAWDKNKTDMRPWVW